MNKRSRRTQSAISQKLRAQLVDCSHWPERILFLDAETTGLNHRRHKITLIGWSFNGCANTFIPGQDPSLLHDEATRAKALVTFNGSRFDNKFIRREFPQVVLPSAHIDLMFLCRRIGLSGGQKAVENALGINLRNVAPGLDGADAAALGRKHTQGDCAALRQLILYNRADVAAMGAILDEIVDRIGLKSESTFGDVRFQDWSAPPSWQEISGV